MSQRDFADLLSVSVQQVNKYENGRSRVSAARLFRIAELLEVSVTEFFSSPGTGERVSAQGACANAATTGRREGVTQSDLHLINSLRRLPAEQRAAVHALVRSLTEGHRDKQGPAGYSGGSG